MPAKIARLQTFLYSSPSHNDTRRLVDILIRKNGKEAESLICASSNFDAAQRTFVRIMFFPEASFRDEFFRVPALFLISLRQKSVGYDV